MGKIGEPIGTVVAMPFKNTPSFSEVHGELNPGIRVRPGELLLIEIEESRTYGLGRVQGGTRDQSV
jgi:hypothetical protein